MAPVTTLERDDAPTQKVVLVSDSSVWGGAEEALRHLVGGLPPRFAITVAGTTAPIVERIAAGRPDADVVVLPPVGGKLDAAGLFRTLRALRAHAPGILHVSLTSVRSCRYVLAAALLIRDLRVVAVEQLPVASTRQQRRWRRVLARRFAAHVAVGDASARFVERDLGLRPHTVVSIPNGVPAASSDPVPRPFPGPTVGAISRLDHQKGFDVLLRAAADLDVSVVLVGDGPEGASLRRLAHELGIRDRVLFTGWDDDARRWLSAMDVFVLPSRYEGFPLSIVEAMLARVPVIATDVGSVSQAVVPGVTGRLVPPDDVAALQAALQAAFDDRDASEAMAEKAFERAIREYSDKAMVAAFANLYDRIGP